MLSVFTQRYKRGWRKMEMRENVMDGNEFQLHRRERRLIQKQKAGTSILILTLLLTSFCPLISCVSKFQIYNKQDEPSNFQVYHQLQDSARSIQHFQYVEMEVNWKTLLIPEGQARINKNIRQWKNIMCIPFRTDIRILD